MDNYDYPWYFKKNGVLNCWDITTENGVVIDIIDSCVDFTAPPLQGKSFFSVSKKCTKEGEELKLVHGTAIAGLIFNSCQTLYNAL